MWTIHKSRLFFTIEHAQSFNRNAVFIWFCRKTAAWLSGRVNAWVIACVSTCCSIWEVGPVCCKAWAGTWTVSALGTDAGFPGWAGMVIWTGTNLSGFVMTSWGALAPAPPPLDELSSFPFICVFPVPPASPVVTPLPAAVEPTTIYRIYTIYTLYTIYILLHQNKYIE